MLTTVYIWNKYIKKNCHYSVSTLPQKNSHPIFVNNASGGRAPAKARAVGRCVLWQDFGEHCAKHHVMRDRKGQMS